MFKCVAHGGTTRPYVRSRDRPLDRETAKLRLALDRGERPLSTGRFGRACAAWCDRGPSRIAMEQKPPLRVVTSIARRSWSCCSDHEPRVSVSVGLNERGARFGCCEEGVRSAWGDANRRAHAVRPTHNGMWEIHSPSKGVSRNGLLRYDRRDGDGNDQEWSFYKKVASIDTFALVLGDPPIADSATARLEMV